MENWQAIKKIHFLTNYKKIKKSEIVYNKSYSFTTSFDVIVVFEKFLPPFQDNNNNNNNKQVKFNFKVQKF